MITEKEARKLGVNLPKKKRKYNNNKPIVDNVKFDSNKEARYYNELKIRQQAGEIEDFQLQPEFVLQEGFRDKTGKKHRAIKYRADFKIKHIDDSEEIIDVKGYKTNVYRIKKKLLLYKYPDINFKEVTE